MLTIDEVGDIVHRPRAIKCIHRDEVFEGRGLKFTKVLLHPCRLELEGTDGLPFGIESVGRLVVNGDVVDVDVDPSALLDVGESFLDHR